ncbi:MAG: T9SS type A sorting domain-containing protein [Prolixibacteraceae bacterium]|nr:T9SS type A sorting domain-containing protein [Prolixibacteraceae bacterium]
MRISESKASNYQVNIVNLAGQTVFSNSYSNPFFSVNTEKFTTGVYLLNIKTDDGRIHNSKLLER